MKIKGRFGEYDVEVVPDLCNIAHCKIIVSEQKKLLFFKYTKKVVVWESEIPWYGSRIRYNELMKLQKPTFVQLLTDIVISYEEYWESWNK